MRDVRCELILFMCQNDMALANGRVASRADVNRGAEAFELLDEAWSVVCNVAHFSHHVTYRFI